MKKLFLIAALLFASVGVFADEFDDVVVGMRNNVASQGWKVRSNKAKRIIYVDVKLPSEVTSASNEELYEFKKAFIQSFRQGAGPKGIARMKRIGATLCINLILTNDKVYPVMITPADL